MIASDSIVHAYDPIPLRDNQTLLIITDAVLNCESVFTVVNTSFNLPEFNYDYEGQVSQEYIRFVTDYILQVALALYDCHSNGLVHGSLDLTSIIVTKIEDPQKKLDPQTVFKLTNFEPWTVDTFPLRDSHQKFLQLLKSKNTVSTFKFSTTLMQILKKTDIEDVIKTMDIYSFGVSVIQLLQGNQILESPTFIPSCWITIP